MSQYLKSDLYYYVFFKMFYAIEMDTEKLFNITLDDLNLIKYGFYV